MRGRSLTGSRTAVRSWVSASSSTNTVWAFALGVVKPPEGLVSRAADIQIGYVPQKLEVDWTLPFSVERLMRPTGPVSEPDTMRVLELVGIPHLRGAEVRHFSGEVALCDLIAQIRDEISCGVLQISHDLHVVMAATDSVIYLNSHVCCQGATQVVAEDPEYKRLFGDRAAATLAVYKHSHDHTHLPDQWVRHHNGSITDHRHSDDGGVLSHAHGPLSACTILDRFRDDGFRAPLQVYRALEKLLDYGLVHRLESMNAFVACGHAHCGDDSVMGFAICDKCGTVTAFFDDKLEKRPVRLARSNGFRQHKAAIELRGLCESCAAAEGLLRIGA